MRNAFILKLTILAVMGVFLGGCVGATEAVNGALNAINRPVALDTDYGKPDYEETKMNVSPLMFPDFTYVPPRFTGLEGGHSINETRYSRENVPREVSACIAAELKRATETFSSPYDYLTKIFYHLANEGVASKDWSLSVLAVCSSEGNPPHFENKGEKSKDRIKFSVYNKEEMVIVDAKEGFSFPYCSEPYSKRRTSTRCGWTSADLGYTHRFIIDPNKKMMVGISFDPKITNKTTMIWISDSIETKDGYPSLVNSLYQKIEDMGWRGLQLRNAEEGHDFCDNTVTYDSRYFFSIRHAPDHLINNEYHGPKAVGRSNYLCHFDSADRKKFVEMIKTDPVSAIKKLDKNILEELKKRPEDIIVNMVK